MDKRSNAAGGGLLLAALCALPVGLVAGCTESRASGSAAAADAQLVDATLEPWRAELLEIAYSAGAALPLVPHEKTRARVQESAVALALTLDVPSRALEFVRGIENWRRGAGFADYAEYCVRNGAPILARRYVDLARATASEVEASADQTWRRDRILSKIAVVEARLGRLEDAEAIGAALEGSETGRLETVRAELSDPTDSKAFEEQLEALDAVFAASSLDHVSNALHACAALHERFYAQPELRMRVAERVKTVWRGRMPQPIRIEVMMRLVENSIGHADLESALELVASAEAMVDEIRWLPEAEVPTRAKLAALRFRAGDEEGGRSAIHGAIALYQEKIESIFDIDRSDALRPVAEALHAIGDDEGALEMYARALEAGALNPNSRPRAEDLAATCCSMALTGVEPGESLAARIREIRANLGAPW